MNFSEVIFGDGRWVYLWHGLEVTLVLTVLSVALGVIIGIIIALMRVSKIRPFSWLGRFPRLKRLARWNPVAGLGRLYVEIIRGTPLLVQLLIMYYVVFGSYRFMPKIFVAAIAFGINSGAYVAEIIRGGIESIDNGQLEAARSLGLSYPQAMRYVILPQAMKNSLPALISECIAMLKETVNHGTNTCHKAGRCEKRVYRLYRLFLLILRPNRRRYQQRFLQKRLY
jgi:arginine/lysine/histidine transport system permease protein